MPEYGNAVVLEQKYPGWEWIDWHRVMSVVDHNVRATEKAIGKSKGIRRYRFDEVEFRAEPRDGKLVVGWKAQGD